MTQSRKRDVRGSARAVLEVERPREIERIYPCLILDGNGVDQDGCTRFGDNLKDNVEFCRGQACGSPWRRCAACKALGTPSPPRLVGGGEFCWEHVKTGEGILREKMRPAEQLALAVPVPVLPLAPVPPAAGPPNGAPTCSARQEPEMPSAAGESDLPASKGRGSGKRSDPFAEIAEIEAIQKKFPEATQEEIAKRLDVSSGWVSQRMMFKRASPKAHQMVRNGGLNFSKVLRIAKLSHSAQEALLEKIAGMTHDEVAALLRKF